jgi:hypothetical protein
MFTVMQFPAICLALVTQCVISAAVLGAGTAQTDGSPNLLNFVRQPASLHPTFFAPLIKVSDRTLSRKDMFS